MSSRFLDEKKEKEAIKLEGDDQNEDKKEIDIKNKIDDLRYELLSDVEVMDEFEVGKIEKTIADIEAIENYQDDFDMTAAFEKFSQEVLPIAIQQKEKVTAFKEISDMKLSKSYARGKMKYFFAKTAGIASVFLISTIGLNFFTVVFADFNIFSPIINWTTETFQLRTENGIKNPTILENGQKLYSNFRYLQRDYSESLLIPSYAPTEYELTEIVVTENKQKIPHEIIARFSFVDDVYSLTINQIESSDITDILAVEREDASITEISVKGVTCYIFNNNNWNIGVWHDKKYAYTLMSTLPISELENVIKSIKWLKGE